MAVSPLPGPAGDTVVLLCSDLFELEPCPVSAGAIATGLSSRGHGGVRLFVVKNLCSEPARLALALRGLGGRRVAVGCRQLGTRRGEIIAHLRRAGLHPAGVQLVDLMPAATSQAAVVTEQSIAHMDAALARLAAADLEEPVRERLAPRSVDVSRRSLFRPGEMARRPVAAVRATRCPSDSRCTACLTACPHGALHLVEGGLSVDPSACTGCGACLSACPSGAISLNGTSIGQLEAAASALATAALRLGTRVVDGVAIVCREATADVAPGGRWLPLEVPSLEMVSAGWALQLLSAGVAVTHVGCGEEACARREDELTDLCTRLIEAAAPQLGGLVAGPVGDGVPAIDAPWRPPADRAIAVVLREPAASVQALSAIISSAPALGTGRPWSVGSPASPLGEIAIEAAGCSACGCCVLACPTGALQATQSEAAAYVLSFDAADCSACDACVASCPEGVVTLRRLVASDNLTPHRRPIAQMLDGGHRCASCGGPLAAGLAGDVVAQRIAASHPEIAARLLAENRCSDCLLSARS
ncbi:MAG: 4Fe-4S binding protein [Acidimicrobiales bacterium]